MCVPKATYKHTDQMALLWSKCGRIKQVCTINPNQTNNMKEAMKIFTYSELGITTKKYMKLIPFKYRDNYMNFSNMDREHYLSIYESTMNALVEKINNSIYYVNILRQMIKQFKYYIILSNNNNYIWYGLYSNLYKKMMIEHYVFIISIMNYVLKKKDFEGEEHLIAMLQHLFTEELIEIIE